MTSASLRAFSTSHRCLQALQILGSYQFRQQTVFESVEIIFHCLQTVILIQWDCRAEWERQKQLYKNYALKFKCDDDDTLRRRLNLQIWMYFDWNRSLCNSSPITFSSLDLLRRPHAVSYKIFLPKLRDPHLILPFFAFIRITLCGRAWVIFLKSRWQEDFQFVRCQMIFFQIPCAP